MFSKDCILEEIEQNRERFSEIRRYFHRIPELGLQEEKTTVAICHFLEEYGIEPIRLEPTGVCGYLGPEEGPVMALRADIDGLAVTEETGLSCSSTHPGYMHACGHDGHIAGLLGVASILKAHEEELPLRVKLIFQPSEENAQGARKLIDQGIMDDVDAIFGLHLFSDIPYGIVNVEAGPRMAQTDRFFITFYGKGGHAGKPHQCVDATVMAADFVVSVQSIVAREIDPVDGAVATIGSLHSGTQYNIISPKAELAGTCRSYSVSTARKLQDGIERRARAIADYYGGSVEIQYEFGNHPPVDNEEEFSKLIYEEAKGLLQDASLQSIKPLMLGEDFSWYQTMVPGVFAFVGCGPEEGPIYPNHHPRFDIDERSLEQAVSLHIASIFAFIKKIKKF